MKNFILLLLLLPAFFSKPEKKKIVLSEENSIKLAYYFPSQTRIRLFLSFKSDGYIAFGLGAGMSDSDILICNFKDEIPQIKDSYSTRYKAPFEDNLQDWTLISGRRKNGVTKFVVERELKTGDSQDKDILVNTPQSVIWAIGKADGIMYHFDKRGVH